IIASGMRTPTDLKGLRVGYPPGSSARFTFERMLDVAHLTFADIISVPLQPRELEAALRDHRADAVIAWEPTASRILANVPDSHPAFRSETLTYAAMDLDFCERQPALQKALLAALLRAAHWGGAEREEPLHRAQLDSRGRARLYREISRCRRSEMGFHSSPGGH
ncbi:MAG: ABC transporter substrate-binding protein, partial [bacterium]